MPKYEVRLESQSDDQARLVTVTADTPELAAAAAEQREVELVEFRIADADTLGFLDDALVLDDDGKVVGPVRGRPKAQWHAHHQAKPYVVQDVAEVKLSDAHVDRLVSELARLHHDQDAWDALLERLRDNGTPLAAVTAFMYGVPVKNQYDGTAVVDWDTDTIKIAILTGHTPSQDTHDFFNDVSSNEVSGTNYTAGGATLASKTATYDTASDQTRLDAADPSWASSTISGTHAVVYKSTGTSSTSPLMSLIDFGGTVSTTSGTFLVTFDATGVIVVDVT